MDSWDDDEFEVPTINANNATKLNWDDEEEEVEAPAPIQEPTPSVPKGPLKPKQLKKLKMKELEEKRELEVKLTKARLEDQANETEDQRKAREKAAMEEADFEAAVDAFASVPDKSAKANGDDSVEGSIESMRLMSLADHEKLGEAVSKRLAESNAKYALECIKVLLTKGTQSLSADDMKELTTILNVVKNDKIQRAKPKTKKKKQTGRQGYANVERSAPTRGVGAMDYDEYDDFDEFM